MERYKERRTRLMKALGQGIAVIPGTGHKQRNSDVDYAFRQDSDFYYLTGLEEPHCVLVLTPGSSRGDTHLFVRPKDPTRETWDGPMAGLEGAVEHFGADKAYPFTDLAKELPTLMEHRDTLFYTAIDKGEYNDRVMAAMRDHRRRLRRKEPGPDRLVDLSSILHSMRYVKDAQEVTCLRRAGEISAAGHREAMRIARPGLMEFQVQAGMEFVFRGHGSPRNGYSSIVATGANATILHYVLNNAPLKKGDLLLIDAGAEFDYYTADITRTFPVSGSFSAVQRDVYDVVLAAQRAGIAASVVGANKDKVHDDVVRILSQGLLDLGALEGSVDEVIEKETFKKYYMHGTGHWLGMDVHDVGLYYAQGDPVSYVEGTVTTVEPGLYFADSDGVPEAFRGIGIRIEDDILTTDAGPVNLTAQVPTDPDEIEILCNESTELSRQLPALPY